MQRHSCGRSGARRRQPLQQTASARQRELACSSVAPTLGWLAEIRSKTALPCLTAQRIARRDMLFGCARAHS